MQSYKRNLILGIIALIFIFNISGARAARYPGYSGYVNDFANILDQRSRAELELITSKLRDEQGIELAIVTIPTTAPEDPKSYITGIFGEWGVGGPEDSGLMILLSLEEGAIEVETGYGLEGTLPDGLVGAVIDQEGLDHFKKRDYGRGLVNMSQAYANILAGEEFAIKEERGGSGWLSAFVIFILIVVLLNRARRYPPGGTSGGSGGGGGTRGPVIIPRTPTRMGPTRSGGFGGSSGRSGGFGGGRSGGGGAGRRF